MAAAQSVGVFVPPVFRRPPAVSGRVRFHSLSQLPDRTLFGDRDPRPRLVGTTDFAFVPSDGKIGREAVLPSARPVPDKGLGSIAGVDWPGTPVIHDRA